MAYGLKACSCHPLIQYNPLKPNKTIKLSYEIQYGPHIILFHKLVFNPCSPEGFSQTYFPKGGLLQPPLWIINTEGHTTLNLLPVYRYGHPLSIDTKISTNH